MPQVRLQAGERAPALGAFGARDAHVRTPLRCPAVSTTTVGREERSEDTLGSGRVSHADAIRLDRITALIKATVSGAESQPVSIEIRVS